MNRLVILPFLKIQVELSTQALERLKALPHDCGLLIASNHPSFTDPFVIFEVTRRWGRACTWMAAREVFSKAGGWLGSLIRRTGAFSVLRGGNNQDAEQYAQRILREGRFPIVIFPEGHTFYLNDVILPLKPGIASWALEALVADPSLPIRILPMAIKYQYTEDIREPLDRALSQLERIAVRRLPPVAAGEFWNLAYVRLHRIADAILSRQEHHYHYRPPRQSDIDERVRGLCATILGRLETRYLGQIQCGDFFDRSRHLMAMLKDDDSPQHQKDALDARFAWALSTFYAGYLSPDSPPERFAETVMKLQRELKHRVPISFRADRTAVVDVGRPLDVASYITPHHLHDGAARRLAADAILADLGGALREMVQTLQQQPFRGSGVGDRWSGVRGPDIACEGDRHRSNA